MNVDAGLLAQYIVIALAVVLSAWFVLKRQFPGAVRKARLAIAVPLVRSGLTVLAVTRAGNVFAFRPE